MSKDSSIKVFAENVGDTNPRPVNNIPVWIENVSAIGGGGEPVNMSAKLDASAVGFYKDYYGTYYVSGISGKQLSAERARRAEVCGNADIANTANYAYTAEKDSYGNYLTDTYYSIQNLSSFVQNNSANWGGSGPTGDSGKILFHKYYYYDPSNGTQNVHSYVSGVRDLFFEAGVNRSLGTPNEMIVLSEGYEVGRVYWTQTSSDEFTNYYTATYTNSYGEIEFSNNGFSTYSFCRMSANGIKTDTFNQVNYSSDTQTNVKLNITGSNVTGNILGYDGNDQIGLTSYTGTLSNFTANGYFSYENMSYYETFGSYYYDLSAEFGNGGSTVTSGDVLPPGPTGTGNTYALCWNDANGLFWDIR